MNRFFTGWRKFVVLLLAGTSCIAVAQPQAFPDRPISIIVPFGPGGGTDLLSRTIATKLGEMNGWTLALDFKPGAGGAVGMAEAAKAPRTGYVMVMGATDNLSIAPWLQKSLSYDALKDVTPVAKVAESPIIFVTSESSPYKTLADVVQAARASPGKLTLGTAGTGSVSHLALVAFGNRANVSITHVPYKGAGPILADLLGGHIQFAGMAIPSALALIKAGKVRALGVTSAARSSILPDVPTIAEQGYQGFKISVWYGLLVPTGVPAPIINRLNRDVNTVLEMPSVREVIQSQGAETDIGSPAAFAAMIQSEYVKWRDIVRASGLNPE